MTEPLDLPCRYRETITALLRRHMPGIEVWAYGSRVNGRSHPGSDLDLVLRGPGLAAVPMRWIGDLTANLEQSNIPILVQVQDWAQLPASFHREIERNYFVLVKGSSPHHFRDGVADEGSAETGC